MKAILKVLGFLIIMCLPTWSLAQVYYTQDFDNDYQKGVIGNDNPLLYVWDTTDISWRFDMVPGSFVKSSFFMVRFTNYNNYLEATNTNEELVWYSGTIDLDPNVPVDLNARLLEFGAFENADYINVYYVLDNNGIEIPFSVNGINHNDFNEVQAKELAVSGNEIEIIIRMKNNDATEHYGIDDISVVSSGNVRSPNVGDVVITEYEVPNSKVAGFLELYNTTDDVITLEECKIQVSGVTNTVYEFGNHIKGFYLIPPKSFLLLNSFQNSKDFEEIRNVNLDKEVCYNRTWQLGFQDENTFKLFKGGSFGVANGELLDQSLEAPDRGSRVFQLPLGYWDGNMDSEDNSTPGYFADQEKIDEVDLVYTQNEWRVAKGFGFGYPSVNTAVANAVILDGEAPITQNAELDQVFIKSKASILLQDEVLKVHSKLRVENEGSVTITGNGSVDCLGEISIMKEGYGLNSDYNIWGSPFSNDLKITSVFQDHFNCDIYVFEASSQSWKYDESLGGSLNCFGNMYPMTPSLGISQVDDEGTPDGNFDVGRGYFIPGNTNNKYDFKVASNGVLNNGDISVNIFGSSTTPSDGSNDWNLISNPYPSAISVAKFLELNSGNGKLDNVIYLYNPSTGSNTLTSYDSYNSTDSDVFIASGQGFYVNGNTTTDGLAYSVLFTNEMRDSKNDNFRSSSSFQGVFLSMTDSLGNVDPTRIYFDANAQNGYDKKYDALKMTNSDFNFASKAAGNKLVFNGYGELTRNKELIPLYFQTNQSSTFTIGMDSLVGSFDNKDIILEDKDTGMFYDLKKRDYTFTSEAKEWNDRFFLHVNHIKTNNGSGYAGIGNSDSTTTHVDELELGLINVWAANNEIIVKLNAENDNISKIELIGLNGMMMSNYSVNTKQISIPTSGLAKGVYFVKTELSNGTSNVSEVVVQ